MTNSNKTTLSGPTVDSGPVEGIRSQPADNTPRRKNKPTKAWNRSMKLIRRIHLYSGIFMFPFVLLYGFTGWFFNHPRYFTGDTVTSFVAADVGDDGLSSLTSPDDVAKQVVDKLNQQSVKKDGPEILLNDDRPAKLTGYFSFSAKNEDVSHQITIDPISGSGEVRTTVEDAAAKDDEAETVNPLKDFGEAKITENPFDEAKAQVPNLLEKLNLESAEVSASRRSPSLFFSATVDGVPTVVNYSLASGGVNARREADVPEMELKSFLLRMHLSRTYTPQYSWKWLWALQVDLMFVSMVFWGCSGLLMWWQIKRTRILGAGFLVASLLGAAFLAIGMHDTLTLPRGKSRSPNASQQKPPAAPPVVPLGAKSPSKKAAPEAEQPANTKLKSGAGNPVSGS
ncbi:MAG: hypothetical protein ABJZ55_25175 [Fuerstiella sp.]